VSDEKSETRSAWRALLDVRKGEWPVALEMLGTFFLIISVFWILKPLKKTIFVEFYDEAGIDLFGWLLSAAQAELLAKVGNMFVAFVAVIVFSALSRHLRREKLLFAFAGFFLVTLVGYALVIDHPSHWLAWSFYLYGDLWTTLMVATFFAFLNDSVRPKAAKRLYGVIVLGGVAGGAFGTSVLRGLIDLVPNSGWMWICSGATLAIVVLAWRAGQAVRASELGADEEPEPEAETGENTEVEGGGNSAVEGARLVFRSPYLLSIVAILGLYEIVSTILDFQFTATISHYLSGEDIGRQFATVFTITNVTSLLVQLFVTTYVMRRFRLSVALVVTPLVILSATVGFLVAPILWVGSLLNTADNAFNYSINQSAKEALYTPTTREEKYKAKAFIDMFVQRFAKALAVGVSLLITTLMTDFSSVRWLSIVTGAAALLWMGAAYYAGKRFAELTGGK
jgi:AAA family ATP:ADP antiporter